MTEWRAIAGWEELYEVSDDGRVRSLDRMVHRRHTKPYFQRGREMSPRYHEFGYPMVDLKGNGRKETRTVHKLVLETFGGPAPEPDLQVRHKNGIPTDCRRANLEWGTPKQNTHDMRAHGTVYQLKKTHCPGDHKLEAPNLVRCLLPKRLCRTCMSVNHIRSRYPELTEEQLKAWADAKYASLMSPARAGATGRAPALSLARVLAQMPAQADTDPVRAGSAPDGAPG